MSKKLGFVITQILIIRLNYCMKIESVADYYKLIQKEVKSSYGIYNPTYGYESYWADGNWVFEDEETNGTTTSMPQVCGEECNYLYREIKEVCGRLSNDLQYSGCNNIFGCYAYYLDDLTQGFKTFETYCKFLDAQCRTPLGSRWILVHKGACIEKQDLWFKPISVADQPVSRMKHYFTVLGEAFRNHSLASLEL